MKILTIPYVYGGASHLIPLMVMHHNFLSKNSENCNYFLADVKKHDMLKFLGMNVIPLNYSPTKTRIEKIKLNIKHLENKTSNHNKLKASNEIIEFNIKHLENKIKAIESQALKFFKPDIILEDFCYNAPALARKYNIPRISIQRTGMFRNIPVEKRNIGHVHSLEKGLNNISTLKNTSSFSNSNFSNYLKEYTESEVKIIPGIPSIELLPTSLPNKNSYFYSGPLILKIHPSQSLKANLSLFFQRNKNKKKVYITTGLVDQSNITAYINLLLKKNYAIITNHDVSSIRSNAIFSKKILPLDYICSQVDLVIHHCGSGMYHYPILNQKPSITIGTQCFDREDIALRLQELGVSMHTPNPNDDKLHLLVFEEYLHKFEKGSLCNFDQLLKLEREIELIKHTFSFEKVIRFILGKQKLDEKHK